MVGENTATLTVQETPSDTCTAPASGDWNVNCSDNCTWDTDTIVPGNMTITDSGHLTLSANLTFNWGTSAMDTGEYLKLDIYNGTWNSEVWGWTSTGNGQRMHLEMLLSIQPWCPPA